MNEDMVLIALSCYCFFTEWVSDWVGELSLCAATGNKHVLAASIMYYYYGVFSCFRSYSHFNQRDIILLSSSSPSSSVVIVVDVVLVHRRRCVFTRCFTTFFSWRARARTTPIHRWIIYSKVFLRLATNNVHAHRTRLQVPHTNILQRSWCWRPLCYTQRVKHPHGDTHTHNTNS